MNCPAPVRRDLFFTIQPLLLASLYFSLADLQGFFPKLENLGAFKSVSIVPTNATCGLLERSTFCHSSVDAASLESCTQRFCIQECPYRSAPPSYTNLFLKGLGTCITEDKNDVTPGHKSGKTSFIFHNHKDCFSAPPSLRLMTSFTVTVWLKTDHEGVMCVAEKVADGHTVFKMTLSEKETVFYYRTANGLQPPIKVRTLGRILVQKWIHITLQVHKTRISIFINGLEEDGTAFESKILKGQIADSDVNAHMQIGQSFNGLEQFIGRMSDFRLYQVALTNREIMDVYTGVFPHLHSMSQCRCPGSHPLVHPLVQRYCIPNGAPDTTSDRVLRLHPDAHPLSYLNDNDIGTTWISSIFANSSDFASGIDIVIDLENGEYQVFFIVIQFFSPQPAALKIQRKRSEDLEWEDWQYFARNCNIFQMDNNGPLANPNSVNCLQLPRNSPYSLGNITFSILTPEPNLRPGYNNFYNTPELQDFVKATQVRMRMIAQHYTAHPTVNSRHRYYGINEITISGRCNCHGHADQCDTSLIPYKCLCHSESYTDGDTCDRCLPLFNNKPFREGDQVHAYNCRHCECFNHASSCHYSILADPVPNDHYQGGGGVCNNCLHNTTGRNCEMCKDFFYRQVGADPGAIDVCKPCDCFQAGTIKGSLLCQRIGGHCNCKRYVSGRQCNQCLEGFHNLLQSDPDGCRPCNCNTLGTINGDISCHPTSGQCKCKDNIIGLRCDRCNFGFKLITAVNVEACVPCQCDINGSVNQFCNHITGQCLCRENVKGLRCDTCVHNFFGLNATGCTVCDCTTAGSVPESACDVRTGQCVCKPNFGGRQCNECINGFYSVHQNNSSVCLPCHCDKAGTMDSYPMCDQTTGQCPCKAGVTGLRCRHCQPHMFNLTAENIYGCLTCDCDPFGTIKGTVCDKVSGQCGCRPSRKGRRCDQCKSGFYLPAPSAAECLPCLCHLNGARGPSCHNISGQCMCHHASVAGLRCDLCKDSYFGWDPNLGRCQPCLCHPAGALNGTCDTVTGQCICKPFTEGLNCGKCSPNASNLDGLNPFGCSKTPAQQPPPKGQVVNSSVIVLSWDPPDSPNSNKLFYSLRRDTLKIHRTTDEYPYSPQLFTDTSLSPYTAYSYQVETSTLHGATRSAAVTFRTKTGSPTGAINLFHDGTTGPHSASFNWSNASNSSGPIMKYILSCNSSCWPHARILYGGIETATTLTNLPPFSKFTCWVQACTSGGCLQSPPVTAMTAQAAPEGQSPPAIQSLSSTALHLKWPPPAKPNGIIIRYEIYMRGALESDGQHVPSETRVFQGSGWLSPHPVEESANENALTPPPTSTNITDLVAYTEYEFRILAVNMAGSIFSDWVTSRTGEAAPVFMPSPSVSPLSSSSLKVSWAKPNDTTTRGMVLGYSINMVSESTKEMIDWASRSEVLHIAEAHKLFHIVTGLKPFRFYNFTITLCNQIGCVTSEPSSGRTLAAAPEHLSPPQVETINSTTLAITWKAPKELNGPSPLYHLERLDVSPRASPYDETTKGVRLPGHGYYKFHSSTLPANTYFTAKYEKVLQDECTDGSDYSNCQNMPSEDRINHNYRTLQSGSQLPK